MPTFAEEGGVPREAPCYEAVCDKRGSTSESNRREDAGVGWVNRGVFMEKGLSWTRINHGL